MGKNIKKCIYSCFGWADGDFVLLHSFVKKTQKKPKKEIERAKREMADFKYRFEGAGSYGENTCYCPLAC